MEGLVSLLDNGPDVLTVYTEVEARDAYGNVVRVPSDTPVTVRGRVQPSTSDELSALGFATETVVRFIARSFPGGPWARVEFEDREWDVVGEPRVHRGSPRTAHVTVYLKARSS